MLLHVDRRRTQVRSHHNAADRLAVATSPRVDSVQVVCANTSLSVWLRTEVPNRFDSNVATIESRHRNVMCSFVTRKINSPQMRYGLHRPRSWSHLPHNQALRTISLIRCGFRHVFNSNNIFKNLLFERSFSQTDTFPIVKYSWSDCLQCHRNCLNYTALHYISYSEYSGKVRKL